MISADVSATVVVRPVSFIGVVARVAAFRSAHGSGVQPSGLANLCDLPARTRSLIVVKVRIIPRIFRIMVVRGCWSSVVSRTGGRA